MINFRQLRVCSLAYFTRAIFSKVNPYKVLGVTTSANMEEIKQAYYKLAQQLHPDKNPSPNAAKQFASVSEAYEILSDPEHRRMYDSCG
jgi:DnaJ-class molecular chaperone